MKTAKGGHHKNLLCKVLMLILIIHGTRGISSLDFLDSSSPLDDDVTEDDTKNPENEDNPSDYMAELRNQVSVSYFHCIQTIQSIVERQLSKLNVLSFDLIFENF